MRTKASEVGEWLRKKAAIADHRKAMPGDPPPRKDKQDPSSSRPAAEREIGN